MSSITQTTAIDREAAIHGYRAGRDRTGSLFAMVAPEAYYDRPIALRNPICFYEGHLPAFSVNTLIKRGLRERGVREDFEMLFERGIDPEDESQACGIQFWPRREEIRAYCAQAD